MSEHIQMCAEYQESTEHVEADEVDNSKAAATGPLLSGVVVWLGITQLAWHAGQHDLLPRLACSTPNIKQEITSIQLRLYISNTDTFIMHCDLQRHTDLKSIRTAWGKVWKLLLRLICVPSTIAIFPNTLKKRRSIQGLRFSTACLTGSTHIMISFITNYLHSNYSIDEEQHGYQECNIRKSLRGGRK